MSVTFKNRVYFRIYSVTAHVGWSDAACISEMFGFSNFGLDTDCNEFAFGCTYDFPGKLRDNTLTYTKATTVDFIFHC